MWLRFPGFDTLQQVALRRAHAYPIPTLQAGGHWLQDVAAAQTSGLSRIRLGNGVFATEGDFVIPDNMLVEGCGDATVVTWPEDCKLILGNNSELRDLKLVPPNPTVVNDVVIEQAAYSRVVGCFIDATDSTGLWTAERCCLIAQNRILIGSKHNKVYGDAFIQALGVGVRVVNNSARRPTPEVFGFLNLLDGSVATGNELDFDAGFVNLVYGAIFKSVAVLFCCTDENIARIVTY